MANRFYPTGKGAMLGMFLGMVSAPSSPVFKCSIVGAGYTYDPTHSSRADILDYEVATPIEVPNLTLTGNVLDGDDLIPGFTDADVGASVKALILWVEDGVSSRLFAYIDDAEITVFPMPIGASRIDAKWDSRGIARL